MGSKRKAAKLTVIDAVEERAPYGASAREVELYERLRMQNRRIAELEQDVGRRARGNVGPTLVVPVTQQMLEQLTWLTATGLYGATSEVTTGQLLQLQLRDARTMEIADREMWRTIRPLRTLRRRKSRRGRRLPARKPNGKLRR